MAGIRGAIKLRARRRLHEPITMADHKQIKPCPQCDAVEIVKMLALRKQLDPDAPDAIVFREPHSKAREAAYEIIGLMNPDVDRVEQIILRYFNTERYAANGIRMSNDDNKPKEDEECNCSDCLDERGPNRQRYGEWAGTGIMSNDIGPLP